MPGHQSSIALAQAVELVAGVLPREFESWDEVPPAGRKLWPTPVASDAEKDRGSSAGWGLRDAVRTFPTPTASCRDMNTMERARYSHRDLKAMKDSGEPYQTQTTGSLNPTWVEWLMGYPAGWTDCGD